jgi:hypothetical protein
MNRAGTESSPLTRAVDELKNIAATVRLQTTDHELAITILECAEKLDVIVNGDHKP